MLVLVRGIISILFTIVSSRAFAEAFGSAAETTGHIGVTDRVASVVFKVVAENNIVTTEPATPAGFTATEQRDLRSRIVRVDSRIISGETHDSFLGKDSTTLSINTPTRAVNNVLSLVSTLADTPLSTTTTKVMQVLSMLAAGKSNMKLAYLAPLSKSSRLESNVDCRLNVNGGNSVAVTARFQYVMDF